MSFMTTQALLRSQHTLYESGDLDLLLSAPLEPRTILRAKLCGIAASVVLSFALLLLPIAVPVAVLGHPGLFGVPALLAALSLTSACLGLAIMIGVVALAGPRAARTLGQIVGAPARRRGVPHLAAHVQWRRRAPFGGDEPVQLAQRAPDRRERDRRLARPRRARRSGRRRLAARRGDPRLRDHLLAVRPLVPRQLSAGADAPLPPAQGDRSGRKPFPRRPVRLDVRQGMAAAASAIRRSPSRSCCGSSISRRSRSPPSAMAGARRCCRLWPSPAC